MYWSLGNTPFEREHAYRELLGQGVSEAEQALFTQAVLRGRPVASEGYLQPLAAEHAAVVVRRPPGRPRKLTPQG